MGLPVTCKVWVWVQAYGESSKCQQLPSSQSHATGLSLAGDEGMEKNMETTIMGSTMRIHSLIPC